MKHPITPPSKLLQEWMFELHFQVPHPDYGPMNPQPHWEELIERVAQWAADEQLKVVEQGIIDQGWFANPEHRLAQLRAASTEARPSTNEGTSYCGLNMPGQPSQSAAAPSITNCHLSGPAPSPYGSWSEWFEAEGSKGVIHGIRMESLPLRSTSQQEIADAEAFGLTSTSGSLVDQVAILLAKPGNCTWDGMAVDVIRAVAAWLRDRGFTWVAQTLEKEANQ